MDAASWEVVGRIRTATCTDVVEPDDVGVDDDGGGAIANKCSNVGDLAKS